MLTFEQYLLDSAPKGGFVNTLFEEHFFALVGALEPISKPLRREGISHQLIGGGAVMVHVNQVDPSSAAYERHRHHDPPRRSRTD